MSETVIHAEHLGKVFQIGQQERYPTLRDRLAAGISFSARRRSDNAARKTAAVHWALKDVSFDVERGSVLGIIGKNGAGKSTLLRILSRITRPTRGFAEVHGRVASLLEVGTGFHPELTGRENVFLNGAILGMGRAEVSRKFDEIVAFSGVEQFIDTPVKRYSSGMYMRLAFAVAAHIDPEILIVDEVLAVGDMQFQRKCLDRMKSIAESARTVLFVSHNLQAVRALCNEVIVLADGVIRFRGSPEHAVREYLADTEGASSSAEGEPDSRRSDSRRARFGAIRFLEEIADVPCTVVNRGQKFRVRLSISVQKRISRADVSFAVLSALSVPLFSETFGDQEGFISLEPGDHEFDVVIDAGFLKTEPYSLEVFVTEEGTVLDHVGGIPLPEIEDPGADPLQEARRWGLVRMPVRWKIGSRPSSVVSASEPDTRTA